MNQKMQEIIDKFIREYDLKNGDLPYMYEITESTELSLKAVRSYFENIWIDYPADKQITREQKEIIEIYNQSETYTTISEALKIPYPTIYTRCMKLISMGLVAPKEDGRSAKMELTRSKSNGSLNDDDVVYIHVNNGPFEGSGGYAYKENLNSDMVKCVIWYNKSKMTQLIQKSYLDIKKPKKER